MVGETHQAVHGIYDHDRGLRHARDPFLGGGERAADQRSRHTCRAVHVARIPLGRTLPLDETHSEQVSTSTSTSTTPRAGVSLHMLLPGRKDPSSAMNKWVTQNCEMEADGRGVVPT
jgi:hypothetical protein